MRGFMLDSARCLERREYYEQFIVFAAERGVDTLLWHFTDDQGCSLRFDTVPESASPHAYSKTELAKLLAFARERGVTVIPELETLGHTRFITRVPRLRHLAENDSVFTSICPVAPETRAIMAELIAEVVELFDSPIVHVGLDEVNFGEHPLTQAELARSTKGDIYADYVQFLHAQLAGHNRRMMIWGDHLLTDESIMARTPRDVIVCNWQYRPDAPIQTTQRFLDAGFNVVVCPALISYDQPLHPGESFSIPNLRTITRHTQAHGSGRMLGVITTVWTPTRFLNGALWLALDAAATIMRDGPEASLREAAVAFAEQFHGFKADPDWLDACETIYHTAPMRKEWLPVLRIDSPPPRDAEALSATSAVWRKALRAFEQRRPDVRNQIESYDTIVLMLELLAHAYERAAAVASGNATRNHVNASTALLDQLSAAWDRERYPDDPRKWAPVFSFDKDNHLLPAFRQGADTLVQSLRSAEQLVGLRP